MTALVLSACAIPNISIVESLDDNGSAGSSEGGGTKNTGQGGKSSGTNAEAGDDGGPAGDGSGGTNSGGSSTTGGNPPSGGTSPTGGGGTEPTPAKTASAKFCSAVTVAGQATGLDLRIGSGANLVHIVADSASCSPAVSRPCVPIPTGSAVPVGVYDLNSERIYEAAVRIEPGDAWIFLLSFNEEKKMADLKGEGRFSAEECSATDIGDLLGAL